MNSSLSFLQPFFRATSTDRMTGMKSFMYGKNKPDNISMVEDASEAWCSLVDKSFQRYQGFRNVQYPKPSDKRMFKILFYGCFANRFG